MDEITAALDEIHRRLNVEFAGTNPARLEQAAGALATVRMAVEALYTETPYQG